MANDDANIVETIQVDNVPECICCGAPVLAKDQGACAPCLGVTLDTQGQPVPVDMFAPKKRTHRWVRCKLIGRRHRRAIKAAINRKTKKRARKAS